MLRLLALLSMRGLFARASTPEAEDDEALVEDEAGSASGGGFPGFPGGKMPTAEELLKMLDTMSGLSDEDKEAIRADLLKRGAGGGAAGAEGVHQVAAGSAFPEFLVLLGMLAFITLIFVFFGYKLYKSLSERERKREEKKKNKQMKKKK